MLKGFRDFIMRGNVVDLAVAVIIGAAFNAVVTSFTKDVLMQMISAVIGLPVLRPASTAPSKIARACIS